MAHRWLSIEAKERRELPAWIEAALRQADRAADAEQLPVAVLHGRGRPAREAWLVLRLGDFVSWFGDA